MQASAIHGRSLEAIAAMVMATFVFTLGDVAMKLVTGAVPTGEAVFLRSSLSVALVLAAAVHAGAIAGLRRALVPLMGWRSLGDAGNSLCFQAALGRMPLADIMGVLQLTPLTLTAASALFLGAYVGWRRWSAVAAGLIGALLVIKPGSSAFNAWALLAVLSVLCGTLRDVATRRLDGGISPLLILLVSQSVVALLGLAASAFEAWVWPTPAQFGLIAIAAVLTLAGHLWVIVSLRMAEISIVAPFRYAGIVWAILLGLLIWGELPDALSFAGIAILISAGLFTFYRERKLARGR
jgi:drug/metabolite transporter (DMT)-like permease